MANNVEAKVRRNQKTKLRSSEGTFQLATDSSITVSGEGYFLTFAKRDYPNAWDVGQEEIPLDVVAKIYLDRKAMKDLLRMLNGIPKPQLP